MSRARNVWDNSAMESFFGTLKKERVHREEYRTRDQAKADLFDYVERFYNPHRRPSTIGYVSPADYEQAAGLRQDGVRGSGVIPELELTPRIPADHNEPELATALLDEHVSQNRTGRRPGCRLQTYNITHAIDFHELINQRLSSRAAQSLAQPWPRRLEPAPHA
jgi:hypothetical protein